MDLPSPPSSGSPWSRRDTVAMLVIATLAGVIRGINITRPPFIYSDELFYPREACNYVYRSPDLCGIPLDAVSAHPPLGKWLISLGIRALGWEPLGWRIAGLIAGIATVLLLYVLARRLLPSTFASSFASGLLAIDFLHVVQSRIGMLDVFLALFVVASFTLVVLDRDARANKRRSPTWLPSPWLVAAGLSAGAAIATKWIGVLALLGVAALSLIWAARGTPSERWPGRVWVLVRREGLGLATAFVIAPGLAYVAASAPSVEGSLLAPPWAHGSWTRSFARVQRDMLLFHRYSPEIRYVGLTNRFASPAWSWPLIKRPMIYYSEPRTSAGRETIMAMGNPLVWWASLAGIAALGIRLMRRRYTDAALVSVVGFVTMYVPLLLVNTARAATFLYYMLPSVPFMCLALATLAAESRSQWSRRIVVAFSVAATALFAFFYPVLTGVPLSQRSLDARQWFRDCRQSPGIAAPIGWCWK